MFNYLKLIKLIFDTQKQEEIAEILIESGKQLSVAESCTGGLVSSLITDISGSSSFIKCNFVTYANEAKNRHLGVSEETLKNFGAVSEQTANEMVRGLLKNTGSDYALATTGIAGPTGGTPQKPVGLVYIGIGSKNSVQIHKYNVNAKYPRVLIKYMFAKHALALLSDFIKESENIKS